MDLVSKRPLRVDSSLAGPHSSPLIGFGSPLHRTHHTAIAVRFGCTPAWRGLTTLMRLEFVSGEPAWRRLTLLRDLPSCRLRVHFTLYTPHCDCSLWIPNSAKIGLFRGRDYLSFKQKRRYYLGLMRVSFTFLEVFWNNYRAF